MNEETRPGCYRGESGEVCQSFPRPLSDNKADSGSSISSTVNTDNSVNKHMPYIWMTTVIASISLGLSIGMYLYIDSLRDKATVSENHWRNIEVEVKALHAELEERKHAAR